MIITNDGYSTLYTRDNTLALAQPVAEQIPHLMSKYEADTIVVSGNSGVSLGFAALTLVDFPLVLVRKDNDSSHGAPIEGPYNHKINRYLILDDFVGTGATVGRIADKILTLARMGSWGDSMQNLPNSVPECVGVIAYKTWAPAGDPVVRYVDVPTPEGQYREVPVIGVRKLGTTLLTVS